MSRSAYNYNIRKEEKKLHIIDLYDESNPTMTVTNDMENVLSEIERKENVDLSLYHITYTDSYGDIDGVDYSNNRVNFYFIKKSQ